MKKWLILFTFVLAALVAPLIDVSAAVQENSKLSNQESALPLAKTHAHNDYEHTCHYWMPYRPWIY